jgi:hypothetical protein
MVYTIKACEMTIFQIEKCMARSCDNIPQVAALHVKGSLNGQNLYNVIAANITDMGPRRAVSATIKDIIKQQVRICFVSLSGF